MAEAMVRTIVFRGGPLNGQMRVVENAGLQLTVESRPVTAQGYDWDSVESLMRPIQHVYQRDRNGFEYLYVNNPPGEPPIFADASNPTLLEWQLLRARLGL